MQTVVTTPITLALGALVLWLGPLRGFWLVLGALPFGVMAAFNLPSLGGTSILLADIAVLSLIAVTLCRPRGALSILSVLRIGQPGAWVLPIVCVTVLSAVFCPRIFAGGVEVYSLARSDGSGATGTVLLGPSMGNVSQLMRLGLGLAAFTCTLLVLRGPQAEGAVMRAIMVATGLHIALSAISLIASATGLDLMSWMRTANYEVLDHQAIGGLKRLVGGFSEASGFGYFTLGLFGFWLSFAVTTGRGWIVAIVLLLLLIRSLSTAAIGATGLLAITFAAVRLAKGGAVGRPQLLWAALASTMACCAVLCAVVLFVPTLPEVWDSLFTSKLAGHSGQQRLGWSQQAMMAFGQTYGLGAGIGSVRGSGWIGVMLGSVGAVGTALLLGFLVSCFRQSKRTASAAGRALYWGAFGMLIQSCLVKTTPDLELAFYLLLAAAVALSQPHDEREVRRRVPPVRRGLR